MKNFAAISTKARGDLLLFSAYFKWPKRGSWIRIRKGIPSSTELCNVNSMLASFPPGMLKTCHENVSARWVRVWVCVRTCVSVRVCVCPMLLGKPNQIRPVVLHPFSGHIQRPLFYPNHIRLPFLRTRPEMSNTHVVLNCRDVLKGCISYCHHQSSNFSSVNHDKIW